MITEEQFYKEKIFNKVGLNQLKKQYPNQVFIIEGWYCSENYKKIQKYKSFLITKLRQISDNEGQTIKLTTEDLYKLYQWWVLQPKYCHYCFLPENELENLHNLQGHINKRYPKRGKSLEIDRKKSHLPYSDIDNLVLACYWCNNAKTDTFTDDEFILIGNAIKVIWENRLGKQFIKSTRYLASIGSN